MRVKGQGPCECSATGGGPNEPTKLTMLAIILGQAQTRNAQNHAHVSAKQASRPLYGVACKELDHGLCMYEPWW